MTKCTVPDDPEPMDDATFYRELMLRAELVTARLTLGYWQRRVHELEAQLPSSNPLRSKSDSDA